MEHIIAIIVGLLAALPEGAVRLAMSGAAELLEQEWAKQAERLEDMEMGAAAYQHDLQVAETDLEFALREKNRLRRERDEAKAQLCSAEERASDWEDRAYRAATIDGESAKEVVRSSDKWNLRVKRSALRENKVRVVKALRVGINMDPLGAKKHVEQLLEGTNEEEFVPLLLEAAASDAMEVVRELLLLGPVDSHSLLAARSLTPHLS